MFPTSLFPENLYRIFFRLVDAFCYLNSDMAEPDTATVLQAVFSLICRPKQICNILYFHRVFLRKNIYHGDDVKMSAMASQINSLTIVYSIVYSGTDERKHQSSAALAFVRGSHRRPVNSPHKWAVTQKIFHLMTSSCILIKWWFG